MNAKLEKHFIMFFVVFLVIVWLCVWLSPLLLNDTTSYLGASQAVAQEVNKPQLQTQTMSDVFVGSLSYGGPEDLEIVGDDEAFVGESVSIRVSGLPELNPDAPLSENLAWTKQFKLLLDAPNDCACQLEQDLVIDFLNGSWKLRANLVAEREGVVVLIADWNKEPYGIATHRITIKRRGPPPNVSMTMETLLDGEDTTSPGPELRAGEEFTLTHNVANTGNQPLGYVQVSDSTGLSVSGPIGDINNNRLLDVGEIWVYTTTAPVVEGNQTLTGKAIADFEGSQIVANSKAYYVGMEGPAPGKRVVLILEETEERTPAFASMVVALDSHPISEKHRVLVLDQDLSEDWEYLNKYKEMLGGIKLPALFITAMDGEVLYKGECPTELTKLITLIEEHGG